MAQDSTLDNLRHPAGTATTPWRTLARLSTAREGPRTMLLTAMGFGGGVWAEFAERHPLQQIG